MGAVFLLPVETLSFFTHGGSRKREFKVGGIIITCLGLVADSLSCITKAPPTK